MFDDIGLLLPWILREVIRPHAYRRESLMSFQPMRVCRSFEILLEFRIEEGKP